MSPTMVFLLYDSFHKPNSIISMKQLNTLLTIVLMLCMVATKAQNKEFPLLMGLGAHGPNMTFGDDKKNYYKNWNVVPALSQIKIFSWMGKGFSLGWQLSLGNAKRYDSLEGKFFLQWGVDLKYSFANGYILKQKSWFDPYFLVGGGLNKWGNVRGTLNFGAGLNIWVHKNVGLFVQTQYEYNPHTRITPHADDPRPSFMHHSFGIVGRFGRGKDTDKDGVPDDQDECPTVPGKKEFHGCPDTDNDGIVDKDDKCPTVAGTVQFMGCPDTDGDGIPDAEDACPGQAGPASAKGCPDRDGDGILDNEDQCPTVPGVAAAMGCPDRDGDGVKDADDLCPDEKGPAISHGCPDSDGDGVLDQNDKCPNVYGLAANDGCPVAALDAGKKTEVQQKLSFAAHNLFFETGKDVIKKESFNQLDSVVAILKQYEFLKVSIDGHTDNVGSEKSNLDLSNKRAGAVMSYLVDHGISAPRLSATGYGPYKPIADNGTAAGRAQNRRVEINIKD
ncbi:MAG: cell envelope biosis protein OmpA [Bacteroidetes bacterium]|nr:cell envelope biosis protein OmpA [Bacteroidota bacterium]